jgi:hypothetical protein
MNTRIEYMYRDAENFKKYGECILSGVLTIEDLCPYLSYGEYFIPSEVGLLDLQELPLRSYDHIWHEIIQLSLVGEPVDMPFSAKQFIDIFQKASDNNWNENSVVERLGLM